MSPLNNASYTSLGEVVISSFDNPHPIAHIFSKIAAVCPPSYLLTMLPTDSDFVTVVKPNLAWTNQKFHDTNGQVHGNRLYVISKHIGVVEWTMTRLDLKKYHETDMHPWSALE